MDFLAVVDVGPIQKHFTRVMSPIVLTKYPDIYYRETMESIFNKWFLYRMHVIFAFPLCDFAFREVQWIRSDPGLAKACCELIELDFYIMSACQTAVSRATVKGAILKRAQPMFTDMLLHFDSRIGG